MVWDDATRYRLLLKINNAIVSDINRKNLFNQLAKEIKRILTYDRFSINLYDEEKNVLRYFSVADGISPKAISDDERPLEKGAIAREVIRSRKPVIIPDLSKRNYWSSVRVMLKAGLNTSLAFPLITRGKVLGVLHFSFKKKPPQLEELVQFLRELTDSVAVAVENMLAYNQLNKINRNLIRQKQYLLERAEDAYTPEAFYYASPAMEKVMHQVELVAATDASVLITGETGTGTDFVAHQIHRLSPRRGELFVKVNCPALSASLFESELFGHTQGAFTGAAGPRTGRFEMADGGTIFLDEIAELPIERQAKLLHILQDKRFERVGGNQLIEINVRVVAATNCDMDQAVRRGAFRSDLYHRLNTVSLHLPSLRERVEEVPGLVQRLNRLESQRAHRSAPTYTTDALDVLCEHSWPGNVRELKNLVKRMIILHPGETVTGRVLQNYLETGKTEPGNWSFSLAEVERQHIEFVLMRTKGRLGGKKGAAALMAMPRTTLQYRLKKHGIDPKRFGTV